MADDDRHNSREIIFTGTGCSVRIESDAVECIASSVWPASTALAKALCDGLLPSLKGCRVLELGAGTGLTSAVAAQLGASVFATELPEGVELLRRNLEANASAAAVGSLTWGTRIPDQQLQSYDVVMGADITYIDVMLQPLIVTILQFAAVEATIVVAHTKVHKVTVEDVIALLEQFLTVELSVIQGQSPAPDVALLVARRKAGSDVAISQFLQTWFDGGNGRREYASHKEMVLDAWGPAPASMPAAEHGPLLPGQHRGDICSSE